MFGADKFGLLKLSKSDCLLPYPPWWDNSSPSQITNVSTFTLTGRMEVLEYVEESSSPHACPRHLELPFCHEVSSLVRWNRPGRLRS